MQCFYSQVDSQPKITRLKNRFSVTYGVVHIVLFFVTSHTYGCDFNCDLIELEDFQESNEVCEPCVDEEENPPDYFTA